MEASTNNSTNYALVEQFMHYLLTLSSVEYTLFYCEICYERLVTPMECRPSSPFHENTGTCSHCGRCDDVSSPHMNHFLSEHNLFLKRSPFLIQVGDCERNETAVMILNWLMPDDYAHERSKDKNHNEDGQFSWIKYGRKMEKAVHRCSYLSETSKELLLTFYSLRYRPDRFTPDPSDVTVPQLAEPLMFELAHESASVAPTQHERTVSQSLPLSTFDRFKSFVANTLNHWKGKGYEALR